jgi:hypothetical protein
LHTTQYEKKYKKIFFKVKKFEIVGFGKVEKSEDTTKGTEESGLLKKEKYYQKYTRWKCKKCL